MAGDTGGLAVAWPLPWASRPARSRKIFDATRTPIPSVRPNRSGPIKGVYQCERFELLSSRIGSKVRESAVSRSGPDGAPGGSPLNQRLRSLIQQLGEAIHESVSESEQISEVVQDIRKQGFDVLLMLEATIGLNEVEQQPASEEKALKAEPASSDKPFSAQDVHFLRSLRISVDGDRE